MAYQFKLQVPISRELNEKLKTKVSEIGFSSVNDIVRLLLTNFANGKLSFEFVNKPDYPQYNVMELEKVLEAGMKEYEEGKTRELDVSAGIAAHLENDECTN